MAKLSDHGLNVYSQSGDDGIIEKIFELIGTTSKVSVEFGAWDGFHLSNTAHLWTKKGWKGVLIEGNADRVKQLIENTKDYNCHCIEGMVAPDGENSLENILKREGVTEPIDLLSIDIDSDDYYVMAGLTELQPRVVICEYNATIPPHVELVPERGNYFGCSALSLVKMAELKGYMLVAVTSTNCFFVRATDFPKFSAYETSLPAIAFTDHLTYLITGFAGDYLLSRRPTYGYNKPSVQKFVKGEPFYIPEPPKAPEPPPPATPPSPPPKNKRKLGRRLKIAVQHPHFYRHSMAARKLHRQWESDFAPQADKFLHPLWQKRATFAPSIQEGLSYGFLHNSEIARHLCPRGFDEPQKQKLAYLQNTNGDLSRLVRSYREPRTGKPDRDCPEWNLSAKAMEMLYHFTRIAEQTDLKSLRTIVEFGGGYGCLCRVFCELLPQKPTYIIIDLPEMLSIQYTFLNSSDCRCEVVAHTAGPITIQAGCVNLVPVHLFETLVGRASSRAAGNGAADEALPADGLANFEPDLFVSTFGLSETPEQLQRKVASMRFLKAKSLYLVGQNVESKAGEEAQFDSPRLTQRGAYRQFSKVNLCPCHVAAAWELFATEPKPEVSPLEKIQHEIEDNPQRVEPYLQAVELLRGMGNVEEARRYSEDAIELQCRNADAPVPARNVSHMARDVTNERPIFIFAQGRSGSTLLQRVLNSVEDLIIYGEHRGILKDIAESYIRFTRKTGLPDFCSDNPNLDEVRNETLKRLRNPGDFIANANGLSLVHMHQAYARFVEDLIHPIKDSGARRWGFKEIYYAKPDIRVFEMLIELFPKAQFIFLIRNPFDQIASKDGTGWFQTDLKRKTEMWADEAAIFLRHHKAHPTTTRIIRYEDFTDPASDSTRSLFKWLGLPYTGKQEEIIFGIGKVGGSKQKPSFSPEVRETIRRDCMTEAGRELYPSLAEPEITAGDSIEPMGHIS